MPRHVASKAQHKTWQCPFCEHRPFKRRDWYEDHVKDRHPARVAAPPMHAAAVGGGRTRPRGRPTGGLQRRRTPASGPHRERTARTGEQVPVLGLGPGIARPAGSARDPGRGSLAHGRLHRGGIRSAPVLHRHEVRADPPRHRPGHGGAARRARDVRDRAPDLRRANFVSRETFFGSRE